MGRLLSMNLNALSMQASFGFSGESPYSPFQKSHSQTAFRTLLIRSKNDAIQEK